jgi:hypothetical protein
VCASFWQSTPAQGAVPSERSQNLTMPEAPAPKRHANGRKLILQQPTGTQQDEVAGCRRLPAHRAIVKLNLKPETNIVDLVAWISSITCRQFLLPGSILAADKKVTVYAPQLITPDSAYGLFLSALDSVRLTVQKSGRFYRIIETAKAKLSAVPLYGFDGRLLSGEEDVGGGDGEPASAETPPRMVSADQAP